jgi:dTDP-glucose 4,6-dehydratase
MKTLITGAAGFVLGHYFRKAVYAESEKKRKNRFASLDAFAIVDCVKENTLHSMYWNENHSFYPAYITDAHIMDVIFQRERPDIVIHGAAETCVDSSLKNAALFNSTNVEGTSVIIDACLKHKVKKLIYLSTDQVYGQLLSETEASWTEESPLNPRNPYAESKAQGELLIKASGLTYNIIRSSDCYGYRQLPKKLIPKTIQCIQKNIKIPIYGQGLQLRDWTYVEDHNLAIHTILDKGLPNEVYNLGSNHEYSNIEVVNLVCKAMGRGHSLIEHITDPRGASHDFRYAMNCSKLRALGWLPNFKFKDGLEETVHGYENNLWFLQ